jgi:hypothetical protein
MPENAWLDEQLSPIVRRAIALLDATYEALVDPARWCKDAYARDAEGEPIGGEIVAAVQSERAASRCMFGQLVFQGLARGYRIEIATSPDKGEQAATELTRAPASWKLAAVALSIAALTTYAGEENAADDEPDAEQKPPMRPLRLEVFLLAPVLLNDRGDYASAIWSVALAAEMLRTELDRRAEEATS